MKIAIIIIAIIQILIDIWCVLGVLENTRTLNTILEIIKDMKKR